MVRQGEVSVPFPDVLIALNSAADSTILKDIAKRLHDLELTKRLATETCQYSPPLLISATSKSDNVTRYVWRMANLRRPRNRTDGHDSALFTHKLIPGCRDVTCNPKSGDNKGQAWHCLRPPVPSKSKRPAFIVDLPTRNRKADNDTRSFQRYHLVPIDSTHKHFSDGPAWVFQVPSQLIGDHNDIFNPQSSSLLLALIQISGAVMSLAADWHDTFEDFQDAVDG